MASLASAVQLAKALAERGWQVTAICRSSSEELESLPGVEVMSGAWWVCTKRRQAKGYPERLVADVGHWNLGSSPELKHMSLTSCTAKQCRHRLVQRCVHTRAAATFPGQADSVAG